MSADIMERMPKPEGPDWFPADVTILDRQTGERGVYLTWEKPDDESGLGGLEFDWSDNNNACDCNRADYLARALGREEDKDAPCGDSRYRVEQIVDSRSGAVIYSDGE